MFHMRSDFNYNLFDNGLEVIVLGVIHKWRHGLSGGRGQGFCDYSTQAWVIKYVTMGGGGQK